MKEKRLVDANHFMQVLKNIEYALKGELTHGKIKTSVVQMIEGSLNAEPTIAPESLQPLTYNENRDYIDCDEFICHKCGIHVAAFTLRTGSKSKSTRTTGRKNFASTRLSTAQSAAQKSLHTKAVNFAGGICRTGRVSTNIILSP